MDTLHIKTVSSPKLVKHRSVRARSSFSAPECKNRVGLRQFQSPVFASRRKLRRELRTCRQSFQNPNSFGRRTLSKPAIPITSASDIDISREIESDRKDTGIEVKYATDNELFNENGNRAVPQSPGSYLHNSGTDEERVKDKPSSVCTTINLGVSPTIVEAFERIKVELAGFQAEQFAHVRSGVVRVEVGVPGVVEALEWLRSLPETQATAGNMPNPTFFFLLSSSTHH